MNRLASRADGRHIATITPRDIASPIFRQRRLALIVFIGVFLGAVLAAFLAPPEYEAEMKILVNRGRVDPVVTPNPDAPVSALPLASVREEDLNSEVELIKSRDLLEKVVLACGLESQHNPGWFARANDFLHGVRPGSATRLARAVQTLESRLVVEPLKKTTLIGLSYKSRNPQQSARVLNVLGTLYQEKHAAVHRPPGTFRFFDREASRYRRELAAAESQLIHFDRREGVLDAASQKQLALQQLSQFESQLQQAQANARESRQRMRVLSLLESTTPKRQTTAVRKAGNAQLLADLEDTLLKLELQRTDMLVKYSPKYPLVQGVETQIADARAAIARAQDSPVEETTTDRIPAQDWMATEIVKAETDRAGFEAQVAAYARVAHHYQGVAQQLDERGSKQADLIRDVKTAEDNYSLYMRKREDARISDALDSQRIVNVSIAEAATVPAFPIVNLGWLLIGGFFAAGSLSVAAACAADRLDPRFRTPDELSRYLDVNVLASIPSVATTNEETP
ncbi:MAG: GumC family protein [Candidatus Acidiferrales bacterium]